MYLNLKEDALLLKFEHKQFQEVSRASLVHDVYYQCTSSLLPVLQIVSEECFRYFVLQMSSYKLYLMYSRSSPTLVLILIRLLWKTSPLFFFASSLSDQSRVAFDDNNTIITN